MTTEINSENRPQKQDTSFNLSEEGGEMAVLGKKNETTGSQSTPLSLGDISKTTAPGGRCVY